MRNILIHVPHKEKDRFAGLLKGIWLTADMKTAKQRAKDLADEYRTKCPKAIETLEDGADFSVVPLIGRQKNQLQQYAGAAEQGDQAKDQGSRYLSQS